MGERLLKPAEVAEILRLSIGQIYALLKEGEIPSIRIGKTVRVRREDLDQFLQSKASRLNTKGKVSENGPGTIR